MPEVTILELLIYFAAGAAVGAVFLGLLIAYVLKNGTKL